MAALPLFHGHAAKISGWTSLGSHIMAENGEKEGFGFYKRMEHGSVSCV